jgi:hypothetical protein
VDFLVAVFFVVVLLRLIDFVGFGSEMLEGTAEFQVSETSPEASGMAAESTPADSSSRPTGSRRPLLEV